MWQAYSIYLSGARTITDYFLFVFFFSFFEAFGLRIRSMWVLLTSQFTCGLAVTTLRRHLGDPSSVPTKNIFFVCFILWLYCGGQINHRYKNGARTGTWTKHQLIITIWYYVTELWEMCSMWIFESMNFCLKIIIYFFCTVTFLKEMSNWIFVKRKFIWCVISVLFEWKLIYCGVLNSLTGLW